MWELRSLLPPAYSLSLSLTLPLLLCLLSLATSPSIFLLGNFLKRKFSSSSSVSMRHLTKLGLVLSIVFLVCFLALAVELVYLLYYRRRSCSRQSEDPTYKHLLCIFCCKNRSQVEPTSSQGGDEDIDQDLEKCKGMYHSRMLFTIKEGEKEGAESESGSSRSAPAQPLITPFATPCGTPPFFTPPTSPSRDWSFCFSNWQHHALAWCLQVFDWSMKFIDK